MVYCFILKSTDCLVMRNSEKYIQQPYIVSPHSPLSIQVLNGIMHHTKAKCLSRHGINVCLFKEAMHLSSSRSIISQSSLSCYSYVLLFVQVCLLILSLVIFTVSKGFDLHSCTNLRVLEYQIMQKKYKTKNER